jgi:hypothetical protein
MQEILSLVTKRAITEVIRPHLPRLSILDAPEARPATDFLDFATVLPHHRGRKQAERL